MQRSSVAANTVAQLAGKVATLIFGLATTAITYRILGNGQYGAYVFVTSFVLFFATVGDWGTEIITLREASKKPADQERIIITSLLVRLFLSCITIFLAGFTVRLLPQWRPFVGAVTLFSLVLIALSLKVSAQPLFLARGQAIFGAIAEIVNNGLYFFSILIFLPGSPYLSTALRLLILATLISGLLCWLFAGRLIRLRIYLHKDFVRLLIMESLPTGALLTVFYIYNRVDIVLLQSLKGNQVVGHYGLAYKIHDNLVQGAAFLMNAVLPLIAGTLSPSRLKMIYHRAFQTLFVAGGSLVLLIFLFAPWIIGLVGGHTAAPAVLLLRILAFATFIAYLNHLTGYTLIALGHQRISLVIAVLALVINVAGNFLLIPKFSAQGAAIMTIVTEGSVFILSSITLSLKAKLSPSLNGTMDTIRLGVKTRGKIFEEEIDKH